MRPVQPASGEENECLSAGLPVAGSGQQRDRVILRCAVGDTGMQAVVRHHADKRCNITGHPEGNRRLQSTVSGKGLIQRLFFDPEPFPCAKSGTSPAPHSFAPTTRLPHTSSFSTSVAGKYQTGPRHRRCRSATGNQISDAARQQVPGFGPAQLTGQYWGPRTGGSAFVCAMASK